MKFTVRWTIGAASPEGVECLIHSIVNWRSLYDNECNYTVCHNSTDPEVLERIVRETGVSLVDQTQFCRSVLIPPSGPAWKIYPPRIAPDRHEIILDNDVVVYRRSEIIDEFLRADNQCLLMEAHRRFYGQFASLVPSGMIINSGLVGLFPGYDFAGDINRFLKFHQVAGWVDHCDDEGVLAVVLAKQRLTVIPKEEIWIANPRVEFAPYKRGRCGVHFAGLNYGGTQYWQRYNDETTG